LANDSDSTKTVDGGGARGFLAYWGPPVVIGLLAGLALVWFWRAGGIGRTQVDEIVDRWQWGEHEANEELADEIAALGPSARADVVTAFRGVDDAYPDLRVWIAERLTEEPFFDTKTLADAARGDDRWERRTASVALARRLREEADPDIVMPGLLDWLKDLSTDDHELPVTAVGALGPLPTEWDSRVREALLELAGRRPPVGDPEDDWSAEDREIVIQQGLSRFAKGDPAVQDVLFTVMTDEEDDFAPRVAAVRVLSENLVFDRLDAWKEASGSRDDVVRQAVADNLFRAQDRAYGAVLKAMHVDAHPHVRAGSVDSQIMRRWVRFAATEAIAAFKDAPEASRHAGALIRMLEESDAPEDVTGAILTLGSLTSETYGFREVDVHYHAQDVEESALEAFMSDPEGRQQAAAKYRAKFGGVSYTVEDRVAVLEKLLEHADAQNRAHAAELLDALK
jgi:hypothetical protein